MIETIISPKKSGNVLVTIAIGTKFKSLWKKNASTNWMEYCHKNDLGLLIITDDLIEKDHAYWKKATWQKLLLGEEIRKYNSEIKNVCYIDTDFLINPNAPNVFDASDLDKVNLVSLFNKLPFDLNLVKKRIAYNRHYNYSSNYPLDSSLFMNIKDECDYHGVALLPDMSCAGFFVFNIEKHAETLRNSFFNYKSDVKSITNGGDQFHFNYEIMNNLPVNWLDYRYQAIWLYEMAAYYPFLYQKINQNNIDLIKSSVLTSLENNFFLHFAGAWHESEMFFVEGLLEDENYNHKKFNQYLNKDISGVPRGLIKPNK